MRSAIVAAGAEVHGNRSAEFGRWESSRIGARTGSSGWPARRFPDVAVYAYAFRFRITPSRP